MEMQIPAPQRQLQGWIRWQIKDIKHINNFVKGFNMNGYVYYLEEWLNKGNLSWTPDATDNLETNSYRYYKRQA